MLLPIYLYNLKFSNITLYLDILDVCFKTVELIDLYDFFVYSDRADPYAGGLPKTVCT